MNEHDSEKISSIMKKLGFEPTEEIEDADFIIYNTCLVRENAELKVYGHLGALKKLKEKKPDLVIAVCGCMMQTGNAREVIAEKYKHVDIIFGTKNIQKLPMLIHRLEQTGCMQIDIQQDDILEEIVEVDRHHDFIAYINIMTGCNNFCTYCIVPYARGRELSRRPELIIQEIEKLAKDGYKEIVLLGQNVNSYGKNLEKPITFAQLLRQIHEIDGIERIRFLTSHPKDLSDELIDCFVDLPKLCKNIHLPFQAGNNKVLKEMNRGYTREIYLEKVNKLKERVPEITFSTDIIVGFPGETDEEFLDTLKMVEEVRYEQGFTFIYSIREGTRAAKMENQIPEDVKQERFQRLIDTMYPIFFEENKKYLGKTLKVLVEGPSKNNEAILTGRSDGYKLVHFPGNPDLVGNIVDVKITNHNSFALEGELV